MRPQPGEREPLLAAHVNRYSAKSTCYMNSCVIASRGCVDLFQERFHIWNSCCNWCQHIIKFTILCSLSPRSIYLLHKPCDQIWWDLRKITPPASFRSFNSGTYLCSLPWCMVLPWVYYPNGGGRFQRLLFGLSYKKEFFFSWISGHWGDFVAKTWLLSTGAQ